MECVRDRTFLSVEEMSSTCLAPLSLVYIILCVCVCVCVCVFYK